MHWWNSSVLKLTSCLTFPNFGLWCWGPETWSSPFRRRCGASPWSPPRDVWQGKRRHRQHRQPVNDRSKHCLRRHDQCAHLRRLRLWMECFCFEDVAVLLLATAGKERILTCSFRGDFRKCCLASCLGSSNGTCCAAIDVRGQGGCILSVKAFFDRSLGHYLPARNLKVVASYQFLPASLQHLLYISGRFLSSSISSEFWGRDLMFQVDRWQARLRQDDATDEPQAPSGNGMGPEWPGWPDSISGVPAFQHCAGHCNIP